MYQEGVPNPFSDRDILPAESPAGEGVQLDPQRSGGQAQTLDHALRQLVIGQPEAIEQIVNIYQMHTTRMNAPNRPVGSFLFLGPTGTGKTRAVEATAEALLGDVRAVVKVDCGEFQHSHEIAKLVGSPPGYLGHRETHPLLSQDTLNHYHRDDMKLSFVLFDEIEKASDALWNLLLGILDKATLTLGDNRKVDFSRAMVFLTSNLGASEMHSLLSKRVGFGRVPLDGEPTSAARAQLTKTAHSAARRKFTPEFLNRIDKTVVFQPLDGASIRQILDLELAFVQRRILNSGNAQRFVMTVSDAAKDFLIREGTDPKYGARHLKRAIERHLVHPVSNLIATGQARAGDWVVVEVAAESLSFRRRAEAMSSHAMAEIHAMNSVLGLHEFLSSPEPMRAAARSRRT
jgi:ATP-dependent Clp protease ATP-binding subunit ClpA